MAFCLHATLDFVVASMPTAYLSGEFDNTTEKVDHAAELNPTLGKEQLRRYGGV